MGGGGIGEMQRQEDPTTDHPPLTSVWPADDPTLPRTYAATRQRLEVVARDITHAASTPTCRSSTSTAPALLSPDTRIAVT